MIQKYLFLDIDNTLYSGRQGIVPESAREAVKQARENGSKIFLCTGRSKAEASDYLEYPVDGFIFSSGSRCEVDGRVIYDHPISKQNVEKISQIVRSFGMGLLLGGAKMAYLDDKCYREVETYRTQKGGDEAERQKAMEKNGMHHMEERDPEDPIYKLGASNLRGVSFEPLINALPKPFRMIQTLDSPTAVFWDISDGSIMKKDGIQKILEYFGADLQDAVGIGDSGNDTDMLEVCGIGIAMGNADEDVKQIADWVTTDIDEDGIRNAFLHIGVI